MDISLNIPAGQEAQRKKVNSFIVFIIISFIIATFLRISLLIIYPFIVLFIGLFYRFRITSSFLILTGIAIFSFLLSLFENGFLKYKLLSLFYMLPFLLLLFSDPVPEKGSRVKNLSIFFSCLTLVALINDLTGLVQVFINPYSDDSFVGIYSQYSVSLNGLMLLNAILFFYYFVHFLISKKLIHFIPAIFFLCCAVLGYYGAGLLICMAAFILSFFRFQVKAVFRTLTVGLISLAIVYLFMLTVKPLVLEYNISNIKKIMTFDPNTGPRKIASFYNYASSYPKNAKDFLFGSGPGTFNSRSAFMVGSPTYFQMFPFIKDDSQPYYFKNYAYTLWNENNTSKAMYLDGFRNQPFSSFLAFLGEYGLIFTLIFSWLYYRYYRSVAVNFYRYGDDRVSAVYFRIFKFLIILLPLLLLIDNFYEYPEIMLLVLLGIKFAHAGLLSQKQNLPENEH